MKNDQKLLLQKSRQIVPEGLLCDSGTFVSNSKTEHSRMSQTSKKRKLNDEEVEKLQTELEDVKQELYMLKRKHNQLKADHYALKHSIENQVIFSKF